MSVFLSHSQLDDSAVRGLVQDLEASGRKVWLDKNDLVGGDSWWPEILKQIRACDVFIFAVSQNSLESDPCTAEFGYAKALGRPILPVEIGDVPDSELRSYAVSTGQLVDYRQPSNASAIALIRALSEREAAGHELPDPLPPEPTTPYGYLLDLGPVIRGRADISRSDQDSIFRQLSESLRREKSPSVQASIRSLMASLRTRDDITERTAKDIDSLLGAPAIEEGPVIEEKEKVTKEVLDTAGDTAGTSTGSVGAATGPATGGPAAWLPDPHDPALLRWWDGAAWTGHVHPVAAQSPARVEPANGSALFSILAIVFGLVSLIPYVVTFTGIVALVFGIIAVARHQRRGVLALVIAITGPIVGFVISVLVSLATTSTTS